MCVECESCVCVRERERARMCVSQCVYPNRDTVAAGGLSWVLCVLGARVVCERETESARARARARAR